MAFDLDKWLALALEGKLLPQEAIAIIVIKLKEILIEEPNIVSVPLPTTCVGDIHGQFYDLLEVFKVGGMPPYTSYTFMGDYVDRGSMSIQVITLLCLLKLKHPTRMYLLRGNHETRSTTQSYGFYFECQSKFNKVIAWELFTQLFDFFPIAANLGQNSFAVHGGLSPSIEQLSQISLLDRFGQIPNNGPYADLVWSDPAQDQSVGFLVSNRGAGYLFGKEVLNKFLRLNDFEHMTRAHQLCQQGYLLQFDSKLSTVWSAPNYLSNKNMASIMQIDQWGAKGFNVFGQSPENLLNKYKPIQTNFNLLGIKEAFFT